MGMEKQKQKGEREMLRQIAEVFLECYTAFECMKRAQFWSYFFYYSKIQNGQKYH